MSTIRAHQCPYGTYPEQALALDDSLDGLDDLEDLSTLDSHTDAGRDSSTQEVDGAVPGAHAFSKMKKRDEGRIRVRAKMMLLLTRRK